MRSFVVIALISIALAQMGGWKTVQDTTGLMSDPLYSSLLSFGVSQLAETDSAFEGGDWQVTKINSVQTQVVSGMNYKINCELTNSVTGETQNVTMVINYQAWNGNMSLLSSTVNNDVQFDVMTGGWTTVNTEGLTADASFQKVLNYGVSQLPTMDATFQGGNWEVTNINSVQTQVVAGLNYKIDCQLTNSQTGETKNVTMVVYYQPWTGDMQLISATQSTTTEFAGVGGWSNLSGDQLSTTSNPMLANAIQAAMNSLGQESDFSSQGWTIQRIVSVQQQTVAGLNYKIDVELVNGQGQTQEMEWIVYAQPWSNTYTLTSSQVIGH